MKRLQLSLLGFGLFCSSLTPLWAFDIKPGLWEMESVIEMNGKTINPQAEFKKMIDKMTPAQRKQFQTSISKPSPDQQTQLDANGGAKLCYSKEMLKDPGSLAPKDKNCSITFGEKSSKKIKGTFKCLDGMTGTMEWTAVGATKFQGLVVGKDSKGRDSKINYTGKFVSAKCGALKPLEAK